jgi:FlaA1/EpsC-like NDP-sugar epimerase
MRAQEAELAWADLQVALEELDLACNNFDYEKVRSLIQQLVVEYQPQCGIEDFIWQMKNKT